jgi:hypothetical protein
VSLKHNKILSLACVVLFVTDNSVDGTGTFWSSLFANGLKMVSVFVKFFRVGKEYSFAILGKKNLVENSEIKSLMSGLSRI